MNYGDSFRINTSTGTPTIARHDKITKRVQFDEEEDEEEEETFDLDTSAAVRRVDIETGKLQGSRLDISHGPSQFPLKKENLKRRIQENHAVKARLLKDPHYDFFMLVAGLINTQPRRLGFPDFDYSISPKTDPRSFPKKQKILGKEEEEKSLPSSVPLTPQGSNPKDVASKSEARKTVESASAPFRSTRTIRDQVNLEEQIYAFSDRHPPDSQHGDEAAEFLEQYQDEQEGRLASQYDRPEYTGNVTIDPLIYSAMILAHNQITRMYPKLAEALPDDFIMDSNVRIVFAQITALHVTITRFFHSNHMQLDKTLSRINFQLRFYLKSFANWTFNNFSHDFEQIKAPPRLHVPPGIASLLA